jgi:erythromycin esterase-like protein
MFDRRDKTMFDNLVWHASRMPPDTKIVVWCHSIHAAKDATRLEEGGTGLGEYIHRRYGDRAAAIAFSALGGSYAMIRRPPTQLAPAAPDSLEARAFAGATGDVRYLDRAALAKLGVISARPIQYKPTSLDWSVAFDGFVVFRAETAPTFVRGRQPQQH